MSKTKTVNKKTANEIRYNGQTLAESRQFVKNRWAASVVLEPDAYYTIDEAVGLVQAFLNRKVV